MAYNGTILVTTEALTQKSEEFGTKSNEVKALHDDMLAKVRALMGIWEGNAASAYSNKFNALSTGMDRIYRMIQEHVSDLISMAETYAAAESAAVSEIEGLPASNL